MAWYLVSCLLQSLACTAIPLDNCCFRAACPFLFWSVYYLKGASLANFSVYLLLSFLQGSFQSSTNEGLLVIGVRGSSAGQNWGEHLRFCFASAFSLDLRASTSFYYNLHRRQASSFLSFVGWWQRFWRLSWVESWLLPPTKPLSWSLLFH